MRLVLEIDEGIYHQQIAMLFGRGSVSTVAVGAPSIFRPSVSTVLSALGGAALDRQVQKNWFDKAKQHLSSIDLARPLKKQVIHCHPMPKTSDLLTRSDPKDRPESSSRY